MVNKLWNELLYKIVNELWNRLVNVLMHEVVYTFVS